MKKQIKNRVFAMLLAVMFVLTSAFTMPSVEVFAKDTTTVVTASKNKVSLNYSTLTIKKGKSATLKARKSSSLKKKGLVWTSSNKKVATVDSKGKIKAIKNGKTNITVKVKGTKIKAVCKEVGKAVQLGL